jgi:hypothetical protein
MALAMATSDKLTVNLTGFDTENYNWFLLWFRLTFICRTCLPIDALVEYQTRLLPAKYNHQILITL